MDGQSAPGSADRRIATLATTQHGVVGLDQLRALGLRRGAIEHRIRSGRLIPIRRGVYAVGHVRLSSAGLAMAAVLALGEGAVVSHRTAAALWGIRPSSSGRVDVTVPARAGRRARAGIAVHRPTRMPVAETTSIDAVPVTTPARTLVDLAEVLPRPGLERALEESERLRLFDLRALLEVCTAQPGRTGACRIRAALSGQEIGDDQTRSELERRFLELCTANGLPRPQLNTLLVGYEVDFRGRPRAWWWRPTAVRSTAPGRPSSATGRATRD